eukprot:TRINITY_DN8131_c0_g1_i1.p1 TRINITY_DN8131_c0_g1~~TRINITY_DN8131_c0_g1_i1.p1  ORF type:complete len:150 (+),score=14.05 TRINITY_DN8131_c0_g1_i1:650-1099(+)
MFLAPFLAMGMILLNALELVPLLTGSLCVAFAMLVTGCVTVSSVRKNVSVSLIITIAASFGMADAMESTGVAEELSADLVAIFRKTGDIGILFSIYFCTMMLTSLLSNAGGVALMFPIVWRIQQLHFKSKVYMYPLILLFISLFNIPRF